MARRDNGTGSIYFEHRSGTAHVSRGTRGDADNTKWHKGCTGRWQGSVQVGRDSGGKRDRRRVSAQTRDELLEKLRQVKEEADKGLKVDRTLTVSEALDDFLEHGLDGRAAKTKEARFYEAKLVRAEIGSKKVHELSSRDVERALTNIAKTHSSGTMSKVKSCLQLALLRVQVHDGLDRNVAALVTAPKGKKKRPARKAHSIEEMAAILDAAVGYRNMDGAINLGFGVGPRPDEILGLKIENLDLDADVPAVYIVETQRESGKTKGETDDSLGSRRGLALPESTVAAIRRHLVQREKDRLSAGPKWQETGYLFTTLDGRPLGQRYFRKAYRAVLAKAGVPVVDTEGGVRVPYEMRHTFASVGSYYGLSNDEMAELMGHKRTSTFEIVYKHALRPVLRNGQSVLDTVLKEARSG